MRAKPILTPLLTLSALVGVLAFSAGPVLAATGHEYEQAATEELTKTVPGGSFGQPWGLAFDSAGNLYVADASNETVDIFDTSDVFSSRIDDEMVGPNEPFTGSYVRSVTIDNLPGPNRGMVYVAESNGENVDVFKPEGGGKYSLVQERHFGGFMYVAFDNSTGPNAGKLYVFENSQVVLVTLNADGTLPVSEASPGVMPLKEVPPSGFGGGSESGLAVGPTGKVYLANPGEKVVDVYSDEDVLEAPITGPSSSEPFGTPVDVAVNAANGEIYVVDAANKVADEFSSAGQYISHIKGLTTSAHELKEPRGVAVQALAGPTQGDVYISDGEAGVVDVFGPDTTVGLIEPGSEIARDITPFAATLEAQVIPNNQDTHGYFQYATSAKVDGSGSLIGGTQIPTPPGIDLGEGFGDQPLGPVALTSLTPSTTYYYQAVASNVTGVSYGAVQSFQTVGFPLTTTGEAQSITRSSASLFGTIDPERNATTYFFKYIDQAGYEAALASSAPDPYTEGAETETREMQPSNEPQAIESLLARGLLPETTYHYELVAKNAAGTATGRDEIFTTGAATPSTVTTGGASNVTYSTATLSGSLDTQGLAVSYAFEVSTDPNNYGFPTGAGTVNIGVSEANIAVSLQGLQAGTTYYYRALATSLDGTSYGAGQSFTTPGFPPPLSLPATLPLIASPAIAFPAETVTVAATTTKALTKAQKLAAALKACTKKPKKQRAACRKRARKRYEPAKKKKA